MPIYEYYCPACSKKFDFLVRNLAEHRTPACPKCGRESLDRMVSRFASVRSAGGRSEPAADTSAPEGLNGLDGLPGLDGLDENDPRSMARFMKKMGREMGEELPPEFDEYCNRLEAGEDPEKLEEELGGAFGGDDGGSDDTLYE